MAWVAFDRAVRSVEEFGLEGPVDRWRALRERVHREVCAKGFDPELGCFVQAYGGKEVDASLLLLPLVGFLPAGDPRVAGTVAAVERRLLEDGFVARYDTRSAVDGLPGRRGRVPRLQLLAGGQLRPAGAARGGAAAVRAAARAAERRRPAGGGVRPAGAAAGRELPAGVLARGAGQHGAQPDARVRPGAAPRRERGDGRDAPAGRDGVTAIRPEGSARRRFAPEARAG